MIFRGSDSSVEETVPNSGPGHHHAAAAGAVGLARERPAGHGQERHRRIELVQRQHAADELVPLVAAVVHVAVGEHVQPRLEFDDLDAVAAVDHGRELGVGAEVVRAGVAAGGQFLGGIVGRLARSAESSNSRQSSPRERGSAGTTLLGRLATVANSPYWLTPSHVPPALRSMPQITRGMPDWIFGGWVGRSRCSSRLAATRMGVFARPCKGWPAHTWSFDGSLRPAFRAGIAIGNPGQTPSLTANGPR